MPQTDSLMSKKSFLTFPYRVNPPSGLIPFDVKPTEVDPPLSDASASWSL
jgi:hypothetical protein